MHRTLLLVLATLAVGVSWGETRTWTGSATKVVNKKTVADPAASTPDNWDPVGAPEDGDAIVFDATGAANPCTWDLNIKPASWTQTANTVTFATTYGDTLPFVEVTGNVVLNGGTWTHLANGGLNRTYRLYVKVGGDMTISADAKVTAYGLGYQNQYMAKGGTFSGSKIYGTHGGFGYENTVAWPLGGNGAVPYGKIQAPEEPGSGSNNASYLGGGAIRLDVAGLLTVDGTIDADALQHKNYMGAGGSVYLRAGTIAGSGTVTADSMTASSGNACGSGSGGRVAIILTGDGATFDDFDPQTHCSAVSGTLGQGQALGQSGTIYAETPQDTPGEGWLILKSTATASKNGYCNMVPVASYDDDGPVKYARITVINNSAKAYVPDYATVDMSAMEVGAVPSTVALGGGTWKPPFEGVIDYPIVSYGGLAGIDAESVSFVSGSSLALKLDEPEPYAGDMTIGDGVTVTVSETLMQIGGDLTVNGTINRVESTVPTDPKAISIAVGGDLTVGVTGVISAESLGYGSGKCPLNQTYGGVSGSHGGWGWLTSTPTSGPSGLEPYGSVKDPNTFGAGGTKERGGGVLKLNVSGKLTNNGLVTVSAKEVGYYGGTGGSLNISAASLEGSGTFTAGACWQSFVTGNWAQSAGGRLAIHLTDANADFSEFTGKILANGSRKSSPSAGEHVGSAGTVWLKTAADDGGTLIVDNGFAGLLNYRATLLGGSFMAADELDYGNVLVERSACLQLAADKTLTVTGVFSNGCEFVACEGSTLAFAGTTPSVIYGDVTLCNLSCQTPGKVISVAPGATVTVTGAADLTGGAGNRIVMKSATDGEKWNIAGSAIVMNSVALKDCVSESPITVLDGEDLGGNSDNITFMGAVEGELLTWTGESDGAWANAANWGAAGRAPIAEDDIVIPAGCPNMPTLAGDVTVVNLTVEEGAALALAGRNLTVNGNAALSGALVASGAEVISVVSNLTLAGSFVPAQSTVRLAGAQAQTLTIAAGTVFATLDLGVGAVSVIGDVKANSLTVGDGATDFAVTFSSGATVDVDSFTARGDAEKINGALTAAEGGVWNLVASVPSVTGAVVTGSDASEGVTIVPTACTDGGRNVNWLFVDNRTHWTGAVSTDFADPGNWSDGVPDAAKDAVIEGAVACVVSAAGEVHNLTVSPDAVLRVNAANFAVGGSLTIEPSGTVEWNESGSIAGKLTMLKDSVLTHGVNSAVSHTNRIDLTIGGTGYIAAGAKVDACGKQAVATVAGVGSSHGGRIGWRPNDGDPHKPCYGSILHPTTVGGVGGSGISAGGAIKLTFAGTLKLDGEIAADGASIAKDYGSSGGSIWLRAPAVEGAGAIHVNGSVQTGIQGGGGGRIAIYLTESTELGLSANAVNTFGGRSGENYARGSAGTFYLETAADMPGRGVLTVANVEGRADSAYSGNFATDLPSSLANGDAGEASHAKLVVKHYGAVYLTEDTIVADINLLDSTSRLYLNGHKLYVYTHSHKISPDDSKYVIPGEGGEVIFVQGFMILVK